jgi:hypothetical protein
MWPVLYQEFEDTKEAIRICKTKDRQNNDQKKKQRSKRYLSFFLLLFCCLFWYTIIRVLLFFLVYIHTVCTCCEVLGIVFML